MTKEIQAIHDTGKNLYAVIRDAAGDVWDGDNLVPQYNANWATYAVALTENPSGGHWYWANFPELPEGTYSVVIYDRAGETAALTDSPVAAGEVSWTGYELLPSLNVKTIAAYLDANSTKLAAIKGKTDLISSRTMIFSPVSIDGQRLTLIRGDDYVVETNQALDFADPGTWPTFDEDTTFKLTVRRNDTDAIEFEADGALVEDSDPQTVRVQPTHDLTNNLVPDVYQGHSWDLQATLASGAVRTLGLGTLDVTKDVTRASSSSSSSSSSGA